MGLENKDFSDEDQRQCMYTWGFFTYIFFSIRKTPTQKISAWNVPTDAFKYSHQSLFFFFIIVTVIIWYYLKDCFVILCFKSAEVFTFVKICQSEVLSEERQLMKWVGIFQVRIFWVVIFCGWNFPARSLIGGNFLGGNSPRADFPGNIFFI